MASAKGKMMDSSLELSQHCFLGCCLPNCIVTLTVSSKISGMKNGLVSGLSLLERMAVLVSAVPAAARGHADVRDQVATGDLVDICDLCCCWKPC